MRVGWEAAARPVLVDAVRAVGAFGEPVQRRVVLAGREVLRVERVAPGRRVVGRDVGGVRRDRDRGAETDFLPSRRRLARERRLGELASAGAPQVADVGAGVGRALVEAQPGDVAGLVGAELDAQLHGLGVLVGGGRSGLLVLEDRARADRRRGCPDHDPYPVRGGLEVAAVVNGAAANRRRPGVLRRPCVAPVLPSGGGVPGGAAVDGNLHAAHDAAARVRGGPGDRRRGARGQQLAVGGRCDGRLGRRVIRRSRGCREPGLAPARLDAHVGEQVDRRLLHGNVGRRGAAVVVAVQPPRPLDRARAEDQRVAVAVLGQVVGGRAGGVGRTVVLKALDPVDRRRGASEEARRPRAVVEVLVPLVADRVGGERRGCAGRLTGHGRAAPQSHLPVVRRHLDRGGAGVDHEDVPAQRVLGFRALRVERPRISPGAGPDIGLRVDLRVRVRLLIRDQRAVGRPPSASSRRSRSR